MPDIDNDIPDQRRDEVLHYVRDYYNLSDDPMDSRMAAIGIFGTYKIKALLKAIVRALYKKPEFSNQLVDAMKGEDDNLTIEQYMELPAVEKLIRDDRRVARVLEHAPKLLGLVSNFSQHAAGYVIGPSPITDYIPTTFVLNSKSGKMEQVTGHTFVEYIGLIKMDFLGLRTMSIIQDAIDLVNDRHGLSLSPLEIIGKARVDAEIYKPLKEGNTKDIFQFASEGMTDLLMKALADVDTPAAIDKAKDADFFKRMVACSAIYRPGPMQYIPNLIENIMNPDAIEFAVPEIEEILRGSYGLLIYQEGVMATFQAVAGASLGQADLVRRAISKKDPEVLAQQKKIFIYGDEANGIPGGIKKTGRTVTELEKLWSDIEAFAGYGFNKSHSVVYTLISIIMAWLAHYYPAEFATANLNHPASPQDLKDLMAYYKRLGIPVYPADINESKGVFSPKDKGVMFGFAGIKQMGTLAPAIFAERQKNGPYTSVYDFIRRMANAEIPVTKQNIEALTYSGSFDSLPGSRKDKVAAIQKTADVLSLIKKEPETIFDKVPGYFEKYLNTIKAARVEDKVLLDKELEYMGFYISGHPVDAFAPLTASYKNYLKIKDLTKGQRSVTILAVIRSKRVIMTRTGKAMAFLSVEDDTGTRDITVFPNTFEDFGRLLFPGKIVLIQGNIQDNKKASFIADSLKDAEQVRLSTQIDRIQLKLSSDKVQAQKDLAAVMSKVMEEAPAYTNFVPMSYLYEGKEYRSTKQVQDILIPFDNETLNFVKSVVGQDKVTIIWNSKLV